MCEEIMEEAEVGGTMEEEVITKAEAMAVGATAIVVVTMITVLGKLGPTPATRRHTLCGCFADAFAASFSLTHQHTHHNTHRHT
mmetsp:Transcript_30110/g.35498  ORF Transcript_30110/g.35498 Transcript_30110/m.35498 type:complete len:84 (-) Transcript_30110:136-387(-)